VRDRELLVLRHAKSAWDTDAASDFERPLAKRGRKACPRVGRFLLENDIVPDLVISSPAERAMQTARGVLEAAGGDPETIVYDDDIYGGGTSELRQILSNAHPTFRRIMVVGHNPGFEWFVEWLNGGEVEVPAGAKLFPTAALAWFTMPDDWEDLQPGDGELVRLVRVKELPKE
jgi:phosphohistidine phosphatase